MTDIQRHILRELLQGAELTSETITGSLLWTLTGITENNEDMAPLVEGGYITSQRHPDKRMPYKTLWRLSKKGETLVQASLE